MSSESNSLNDLCSTDASHRRSDRWRELTMLLVLFVLVFTVYTGSKGAVPMTDMVWTVPIALSLIHEGNLDLDEFLYAHGDGRLREVNGHWISYFPTGGSVVIAPVVWLVESAMHLSSLDLYEHLKSAPDWDLVARLNQGIASLFAALTALVIYLTGSMSLSRSKAVLLSLIIAFGTSVWSTASRDLWQHTVSVFAISWVIYLLLRTKDHPGWALFWCGLVAGIAYAVRPTNSLVVLLTAAYVLVEHRRRVLVFLAGAAVIAIPFVLYNLNLFASPLAPYFQPSRIGYSPLFWEALAGNLASPSRGLLVYSPVFLFVVYGMALKIRSRQFERLDAFLATVIVLHWLTISSFRHWWGGASYGPRFFTDLLPLFAYFLIPVVDQVTTPSFWNCWVGRATVALFVASVAWSIFVHYRGSTQAATWAWNGSYPKVVSSVDETPARLWDWSDPQFWRGLRPAAPDIEPTALCVTMRVGDAITDNQVLTLVNRGDVPYTWTLETPHRVFQQAAYDRVPGLGYGEPQLTVDTAQLGMGDHALGGLVLTARAEDGQPAKNSPLVVPIIARVLPAGASDIAENATAVETCAAAPSGIRINGQNQGFNLDQLFAVYGPGWYDLETAGAASWRWTASPARIFAFAPQRQEVTLTSTPIALHDQQAANGFGEWGTMRVSTASGPIVELATQTGHPFAVPLSLEPGWNEISLELLAGNVRPIDLDPGTGDARLLSFALGPVDIQE